MDPFRFKQFNVIQDYAAMRVNTDAVLLGSWVNCSNLQLKLNILDIGTGTGVIALMLGQRVNQLKKTATITAVEIDKNACIDASKNFSNAPWENISFNLKNTSIQEFEKNSSQKYNLVLSNPPFFISSLKSPDREKTCAKHTDTLSQKDLINAVINIIEDNGCFALILPVEEGKEFINKIKFLNIIAKKNLEKSLFLNRLCLVYTKENKDPKRYLMEFIYKDYADDNFITEKLVLTKQGKYTYEYISLVSEFLLNF